MEPRSKAGMAITLLVLEYAIKDVDTALDEELIVYERTIELNFEGASRSNGHCR